jgi:integrase
MPQWMRTAYMLGLWTAQREGDILRLARALRRHRLRDPTGSAGGETRQGPQELYIRAAKPLRDYLDKSVFPDLLFVTDEAGKPIPPTVFRHSLRAYLNALGLKDLHFNGLRHTTATALAELGGSDETWWWV